MTLRRSAERHDIAGENRRRLNAAKEEQRKTLAMRHEKVRKANEEKIQQKKEEIRAKLENAEILREKFLEKVKSKAEKEIVKVSEVKFIKALQDGIQSTSELEREIQIRER